MIDPGTRFWLRHVEDRGGLWEPAADSVLVVLPAELAERYQLPEELVVTGDPDVAREDGATLLGAGHPVLTEAAESVLRAGDAGLLLLDRPVPAGPPDEVLLDRARMQLPVDHGRIDQTGPSRPVTRWVLRVGAMASFVVSAEDVFQEQVERWVDVSERRELPAPVVERLVRSPISQKDQWPSVPAGELTAAVGEAHRLIEADALRRRTALSKQLGQAHERERERAVAYYADVIAGIERRLETVSPDRRTQLADRLDAARQERARRLAEIAEKHQARHDIRPYRLHLLAVPALRLPVDVRRGERRYPMELDWLAPAGWYAEPRCPACRSTAPLVAGKAKLGCLACLTRAAPAAPVPAPRRPAKQAAQAPAQKEPAGKTPAEKTPAGPAKARPAIAAGQPAARAPRTPGSTPSPRATPEQRRAGARSPATTRAPVGPRSVPPRADKLAATVWNAVAERRPRRLRDVVAPGSPAAALCRLYGADGPAVAVGVLPDEQLMSFTSESEWLTDGSGCTAGMLLTDRRRYPYALHWHAQGRALFVVEVLAYPPHEDGRLLGFGATFLGPPRLAAPPAHRPGLDEVARTLVAVGPRWHGLGVTARALAAWWRLDVEPVAADQPAVLAAADQPAVIAAAIHRLVASRAGSPARFREAADAYQVEEVTLRRADAVLRKRLALGAARVW